MEWLFQFRNSGFALVGVVFIGISFIVGVIQVIIRSVKQTIEVEKEFEEISKFKL